MTKLTHDQISDAWARTMAVTEPDAFPFAYMHQLDAVDNERIHAFASRIAALAVQEVERERDIAVNAHNHAHKRCAELELAHDKTRDENRTLTAQLAEARKNYGECIDDLAKHEDRAERAEAALAEVTKERDDQRETAILWWEKWNALRAQLATAKRLTDALAKRNHLSANLSKNRITVGFEDVGLTNKAMDAMLAVERDYPATPSGEGCPCGHPIRGHSHHSGSCPADRPATPSPEAREVRCDKALFLRPESNGWLRISSEDCAVIVAMGTEVRDAKA